MLLWTIFFLGMAFGVAARLGRFCLLRGLRQQMGLDTEVAAGQAPALQAFALASAVALLASQGLQALGMLDLSQAAIARPSFSIAGVLIGGLLFGVGMVLARACGARSLVLLAGGNLRSLVTIVFLALGAQLAMTGVLTPLRLWLQALTPLTLAHATLPAYLSSLNTWLLTLGLALLLLAYALLRPGLRQSRLQWGSALLIGLLVAAGWWLTAHIGVDEFEPARLTSLSFIGPIAEALLYLQLSVGREPGIGLALTAGVLAGAFLAALGSRTARWEGFDSTGRLAASAGGGLLMGVGGVLAAGCSIGQGLSGLSTLSLASFVAVAGILLGTLVSLRLLRQQ
ncbi:YeeE/YedE family protein [Comamonas sp. Tr-654]|uniref:YeeE/YedE family protein n=1 Tax=Comamonas sp. Tr-654 TaxID=2608341 RepID=UPI001421891D|nr:YeeE/YedE family protein [Comamonas sp. Tr-654]NIF83646.1 YeeE/YedE family protein [Comamonas sp. Tr-654]